MKKTTKIINGLFLSTMAIGSITALSIISLNNQSNIANYDSNVQSFVSKTTNISTYVTSSERTKFVAAKNQLPSKVVDTLVDISADYTDIKGVTWYQPTSSVLEFIEVIGKPETFNEKIDMAVKVIHYDDWTGELELEFALLKNYNVSGITIAPVGGAILPSSIIYPIDIGYMNNLTFTIIIYSLYAIIGAAIIAGAVLSSMVILRNRQDRINANTGDTKKPLPDKKENEKPLPDKKSKPDKKKELIN